MLELAIDIATELNYTKIRLDTLPTEEVIVLDDSGNIMDNAHGWPMSGTDAIEAAFDKFFDRHNLPETEEEYMRRLRNPNITAKERIELTEYWLNKDND